ncbi:MAG: DUF1015 family protein [Bacteroidota bacterium]
MQIHPNQLLYPLLDQIDSQEDYFSNAKAKYTTYKKAHLLQQLERPSIFVYQIEKEDKQYNGIVATISLQDHTAGKIKGHEATLEAKELQQLQLLEERQAQVKPILLTYPKVSSIETWIRAIQQAHTLFLKIEIKKTTHRLWKVDSPDAIQKLQWLFKAQVPTTYIADGHHRTAVMARYAAQQPENTYLYCTLFSSDQIEILPFNRVVDGIEERSLKAFLKEMEELCDIRKIDTPFVHPPKHCLQMYVGKQWYALIWKRTVLATCTNPVEQLDPYLLDQRILKKVMKIKDIRSSKQVQYIGGAEDSSIKKITKLVNAQKDRIGFYLPAVQMQDFLEVVNLGSLLPPKSTWFEPRMLNGLLVYELKV